MGIQAHVEIKDLEALGVMVHITSNDVYSRDHDDNEFLDYTLYDAWFWVWGEKYGMHTDSLQKSMWIDVNHWGSNRDRYLPMFKALGVNYIES